MILLKRLHVCEKVWRINKSRTLVVSLHIEITFTGHLSHYTAR